MQPPPIAVNSGGSRDNQPQVDSTTQAEGDGGVRNKEERGQRGARRGRNYNRPYEGRGGTCLDTYKVCRFQQMVSSFFLEEFGVYFNGHFIPSGAHIMLCTVLFSLVHDSELNFS